MGRCITKVPVDHGGLMMHMLLFSRHYAMSCNSSPQLVRYVTLYRITPSECRVTEHVHVCKSDTIKILRTTEFTTLYGVGFKYQVQVPLNFGNVWTATQPRARGNTCLVPQTLSRHLGKLHTSRCDEVPDPRLLTLLQHSIKAYLSCNTHICPCQEA